MDLLHPMRWSKAELLIFETRLRSIFGENMRKRSLRKERCTDPCSFLEPSCLKRLIGALVFHSPTHFFLCACELHLKRVLTFHKCVANVFVFAAGWNFWYADPKGEDMRNIGEVFCCPSLVPCNPMKTYSQIQPSEKDMEERKSEMKRLWVPNLDPRWCKKRCHSRTFAFVINMIMIWYDLQPKFRLMESSIRDIFIFYIELGLGKR